MDDHAPGPSSPPGERAFEVWARRARVEVGDFEAALAAVSPDIALVDTTTYGAKAVAERERLPWAESRPFLLEDSAPGVPPFGFGLRPEPGPLGRVRDAALGKLGRPVRRQGAPADRQRRTIGGRPAAVRDDRRGAPPRRADPLLHRRAHSSTGGRCRPGADGRAGTWDPPSALPVDLPDGRATAGAGDLLVGVPGRRRDRRRRADGPGRAAGGSSSPPPASTRRPCRRPATRSSTATCPTGPCSSAPPWSSATAAWASPRRRSPAGSRSAWCRGRATSSTSPPTCSRPEAGTRVSRRRLSPRRLATAVEAARACGPGAARVKAGYEATGTVRTAAGAVEALLR